MSDENTNVDTRSYLDEVAESVKGFWHWWTGELAGLMPTVLRSQFKVQSKALLIAIDNGVCYLKTKSPQGLELLAEFNLDDDPDYNEIEQRKTLAGMADQMVLLLPSHYILRKTVILPQATASKLDDVLKFEMDRNTPFKAEEVYFIHEIISRDPAQHKIHVELTIVTQDVLDGLLNRLAAQGIKVTNVVPESLNLTEIDNPVKNLLPREDGADHRIRAERQRQQKFWLLLVLIVLVALGGLYQRYQRVESLTREIEEPRALAMQAKKLRTELEQLQESRQFLVNRKQTAPSALLLLNELTGIIPDNTWLTRLFVKDQEITFQGESTSASALIGLVEESTMFHDVRFSSPVTINPRSQKEHFSITAKLQGPLAGGAQ
ncbi:PilN domain-containing protein [Amphritea sp. HPY]|uniref:PilN domain-containing protein n=1 Tax=Amphritea sp. HPY TaxID=3421652 RepID=UPI003D7E89F6